jgi:FAD/FMN-containing dehydrogenase
MLLTGRVVRPGDADYATASAGCNPLFAHRPAVVVFAQETQHVVNALVWARQNGLAARVRSGRHAHEQALASLCRRPSAPVSIIPMRRTLNHEQKIGVRSAVV